MEIQRIEGFKRIYALDQCFKELDHLYKNNKDEKKEYKKFLYSQLSKIENKKEKPRQAEPIVYKQEIFYSIRRRSKKNTRILYYYMDQGNIVLLTAFDEKNKYD